MSAQPAIDVSGLRVSLSRRTVLQGVSLALHAGTWTALVGPNGAGKSTLLAAMAGLLPLASGEIRLRGRALAAWPGPIRAQQLAWLAQQEASDTELSVADVVMLGRLPYTGSWGAPSTDDRAAVQRALASTGTETLTNRRLSELSGGERQRVLVARVLATEAAVMLLDEPGTHLDAPHRHTLTQAIQSRAGLGAAVLSAEHDLTQAMQADRIVAMQAGCICADGPPSDHNVQQELIRVFNGSIRIEPIDGGACWAVLPRR
jgi:iron complex transport system ATP-binding protein